MNKFWIVLLGLMIILIQNCSSETKNVEPVKSTTEITKTASKTKNKLKKASNSKIVKLNQAQLLKSREAKKQPAFRFGKINNIQFDQMAKNKRKIKISDKYLNFTNSWAYDNLSKKAGSGAMIKIDKNYYEIKYGISRPDVSKYLNLDYTINCGLSGKIDISNLKSGEHSMTICLRGTNKLYYLESDPIKFSIQ